MLFDIAIVGAGPNGMALACSLADTKLKIAIIDKAPKKSLENPSIDGREIALTHRSAKILKKIGVWKIIPDHLISIIKEARILDGRSEYFLDFKHQDIKKDYLGYLIPNHLIRKYLYKILKKKKNITSIQAECLDIKVDENNSIIFLSNNEKIKSSLVVAADTRFSKTRTKMGISSFIHNFNKHMIVCRMEHEKPHNNIAYEYFQYNQTLALLPYINNQSSIIATVFKNQANTLLKLNVNEFNSQMENNFNNQFGKMKLIGKRYSYPMITVYSKKFVANRFALIGDAAVGMHPVTAHGFNLGLKGIEILSNEIKLALERKIDIGSSSILRKFQYKLHRIAIPLYLSTNGIVSLYTNVTYPAKLARKYALRIVNKIKPVKQVFLGILK
jgi:ubiquinone biosynthesis UbiH/UbiF/VisC/COQ6 family hydroxylase